MVRPTILIAEPEPKEALSTRKLVLETGKFNVLTAHSSDEAVEEFDLFPNVDGLVVVNCNGLDADWVSQIIRQKSPETPIICLAPEVGAKSPRADYTLSSHEPVALLDLLRTLFGDPRKMSELTSV